jgi:hypothetical protein
VIGSFLKPVVKYGAMIGAVIVGTMTLCSIVVLPLHLNPSMPQFLKTVGAAVPLVCFGIGLLALVFARNIQVIKYTAPVGVAAPAAVYGISLMFSLPDFFFNLTIIEQASMVMLLLGGGVLVSDVFTGWISGKKRVGAGSIGELVTAPVKALGNVPESVVVGAFQIVESPEERVLPKENEVQRPVWKPAESVLRALLGAGLPLIYRLERIQGMTRECYMTLGRIAEELQGNLNELESALSANYPKYRVERIPEFQPSAIPLGMQGAVACLTGEPLRADDPQQRGDPLTVVAEAMLRQDNCILQISALPVAPGIMRSLKRAWLGRKYRSEASRAQVTISHEKKGLFAGKSQESTVYTDMITAQKANRTHRELERQSSRSSCNLEITAACWDSDDSSAEHSARLLMDIMQGSIIPADPSTDLKTKILKREGSFDRIKEGIPVGEFTQLLPVEVAPLLTFPQTDIETPITKRSSFSTYTEPLPEINQAEAAKSRPIDALVPLRKGTVHWQEAALNVVDKAIIGNPLRQSGSLILTKVDTIKRRLFHSHLLVCGNTRSGKSWTAFSLTAQAMKWGMKATIIVPRRPDDWLDLLSIRDDIWVFTPGDPDTAPLRLNLSIPPNNVPLELWMETVVQILSGLLPSDRVMSLHFDEIVDVAYRKCGWNAKEKIQGRPILLSDLWDAVEESASSLEYSDKLRADFYGALTSRMRRMLRKHILVDIYNTEEGITWEQIAENNIIFDMSRLPRDDRAFLMGLLTAGLHMYKSFNRTKEMTNLLVLEEASYILTPTKIQDLYGPDATQTLLHKMVDMFTTGGGNGLAAMAIEQLPGRIAPEIVKLIVNVIAHTISDGTERDLIADKLGLAEEKRGHLQQMETGETLVFLEDSKVVKNIKVWPIDNMLVGTLARTGMNPEQIMRHMEPVYQANQNLQNTIDLPTNIIARLERSTLIPGVPPEARAPSNTASVISQPITDTSETSDDERIRRFIGNPFYIEYLEHCAESAEAGDTDPLLDLVKMVSKDLAGRTLDQVWVARRIVVHTAEIHPELLNQESANLVSSRIDKMFKEG